LNCGISGWARIQLAARPSDLQLSLGRQTLALRKSPQAPSGKRPELAGAPPQLQGKELAAQHLLDSTAALATW